MRWSPAKMGLTSIGFGHAFRLHLQWIGRICVLHRELGESAAALDASLSRLSLQQVPDHSPRPPACAGFRLAPRPPVAGVLRPKQLPISSARPEASVNLQNILNLARSGLVRACARCLATTALAPSFAAARSRSMRGKISLLRTSLLA